MAAFVPFADREEWSDVVPVPQDEGPSPVVAISFSKQFRETMDYFRAIIQRKEFTKRALNLTTEVISCNPANYTAWYYRRICLQRTGADLNDELEFIRRVALSNPKNYQIWFHRRAIVAELGEPGSELAFTQQILEDDAKNYHAWTHRQWVLQHFKLWDGELTFIDNLLAEDIRNNSAWNHRWFTQRNLALEPSDVPKEVKYTIGKIKLCPGNESAWNYLRGLIGWARADAEQVAIMQQCAADTLGVFPECRQALMFAADCLCKYVSPVTPEALNEAATLFSRLAELDPVRAKYWNYRAQICSNK